ncbi:unnamed protein product [Nezara viridula]|uniref:Uncharacterized protein n=1 Tax=Nezara viridula TaxID=85310 RepID=A0A9P0MGD4_NEZVI|nr:unnamed protein product [Nezara viridula]
MTSNRKRLLYDGFHAVTAGLTPVTFLRRKGKRAHVGENGWHCGLARDIKICRNPDHLGLPHSPSCGKPSYRSRRLNMLHNVRESIWSRFLTIHINNIN